jgi:hypothetical protein
MLRFSRFAVRWRSRARARARRGDLHVIPAVLSPELGNRRTLIISTPASYASGDRRYPVLYMQDGQNLFDPRTSFAGDWDLDALGWASRASGRSSSASPMPGAARPRYSPFMEPGWAAPSDRYLAFLTGTVTAGG